MSHTLYPDATSSEIAPPIALGHELTSSQKALLLIVVAKLLVYTVVVAAWLQVDLNEGLLNLNVHYHEPSEYGFLTRFTTWDSNHYLLLAENGYTEGLHSSNAFAPLLPYLIRAVATLTGSYIIAGLLIANAASIAASYLFFAFTRKHWGEDVAFRALILLLAFPISFFMSMIYTESLFFLLCVAVFYSLSEGRLGLAAIAAFLIPQTRWIGILIAGPMALALLLRGRYSEGQPEAGWPPRDMLSNLRLNHEAVWATAPLLSAGFYLLLMWHLTGDPLGHVHAAGLYISQWSISNLLEPWKPFTGMFAQGLSLHGYLDSALDRLFFITFLAFAPLVYRRVSRPLFLFYLAMGLQPFLGSYMSYTRYILVAFPLYIAWASYLRERPRLNRWVVTGMLMLQVPAIVLHTTNNWVA